MYSRQQTISILKSTIRNLQNHYLPQIKKAAAAAEKRRDALIEQAIREGLSHQEIQKALDAGRQDAVNRMQRYRESVRL